MTDAPCFREDRMTLFIPSDPESRRCSIAEAVLVITALSASGWLGVAAIVEWLR